MGEAVRLRKENQIYSAKGEDFMVHRRNEREMISFKGSERVWGRSPDRGFDSDVDSEPEAMEVGDAMEKKKKSKKSKKSKKKKSKKSKKKKKKSSSSDSSDSDDEDCWVEKDVMLSVAERRAKEDESEEEQIIGHRFRRRCN